MKRKLTAINVALAVLLIWGSWTLYGQYVRAERRYEIFDVSAGMIEAPAMPAPGEAPSVRAASYAPISQRLLFSQDRNPVIEVVVPELVDAARPPAPGLGGVVDLGDGPLALMTPDADTPPRWTSVGEKIGEYTLLAIDGEQVTLEWNGESIEMSKSELSVEKLARRRTRQADDSAAAKQASAERVRTDAAARTAANLTASGDVTAKGKYTIGKKLGSGGYLADPNDGAVDGTEHKGYIRRVRRTPFGSQHWWEKKE